MAFEGLSEKLSSVFKKLKSKGKLSEKDVKDAMREVRLALLEADVNYKVAKEFTAKVAERSVGSDVMESLTPAQMVVKIVNEELVELMGSSGERIDTSGKPPVVIMLCGLQGSGKTTHAGKLACNQKKKGRRPLLVACDVYRPAAIKQLQVIGEKCAVPVFEMGNLDPVKIATAAIEHAKEHGNDIVILDTAGRLHVDHLLMDELKRMKAEISPAEILLVVDAMTGQDAVNIAESFNNLLDVTGVILTKLDGDTRGGAALSVRAVTKKPIKFVGIGEKLEDLEEFHPERMASRILGMGDVMSLIEQAEGNLDASKAQQLTDKILKNKMDLNDFLEQMEQMKKLGSLRSIISRLPGVDKQLADADIDDRIMDRTCAIIFSMTPFERQKPEIINFSRRKRIAAGSGVKVEDVNKLLKQFDQMQKFVKHFTGKGAMAKTKKRFLGFKNPFA